MESKRIVVWRSRRGMLELDVLLRPFASDRYEQLPIDQRRSFEQLLELDDVDILELVRRPEGAGQYTGVVQEILNFRAQSGQSPKKSED